MINNKNTAPWNISRPSEWVAGVMTLEEQQWAFDPLEIIQKSKNIFYLVFPTVSNAFMGWRLSVIDDMLPIKYFWYSLSSKG